MLAQLRPAVILLVLLTLITGVVYPLAVTGLANVALANKANGSIIERDGRAVGSDWIGQPFSDAKYFWSRPSATTPVPYSADAGAGSNLSPTNARLVEAVEQRKAVLRAAHPRNEQIIPVDLVTASASGLDPHISVAAARYQISRVAHARRMSASDVAKVVDEHTEQRTIGVLGEPRVNVLRLNLELARIKGDLPEHEHARDCKRSTDVGPGSGRAVR